MVTRALAFVLVAALAGCDTTRADDRFEKGLLPGTAGLANGIGLSISPGRVHTVDGSVVARAASPAVEIALEASAAGEARFTLTNVQPGSHFDPPPSSIETLGPTTVALGFQVPAGGLHIKLKPTGSGPARFAVISDIHNNLETFGRFAKAVQAWQPEMILCMGDLTKSGKADQFDEIFGHLGDPGVPIYTTLGNHELMGEAAERFGEEIGPGSVAFEVRGVQVVLADTAGARFAPEAYDWLASALWPRSVGPALVLAHIPPIEPWGTRNHGFSNRDDAEHFIQVLAEGRATHFFAGHIHSYADYSMRGVPATISGGGGGGIET